MIEQSHSPVLYELSFWILTGQQDNSLPRTHLWEGVPVFPVFENVRGAFIRVLNWQGVDVSSSPASFFGVDYFLLGRDVVFADE